MTALLTARDLAATLVGDAGTVRVLDGVSLDISSREIVDVAGLSGSGKSILLRALARLLPGATGSLALDALPAEDYSPTQWREAVMLLPQKPVLVGDTVRDSLVLPWRLGIRRQQPQPDDPALAEGLDRLGVDAALDREISRLSVGQTARVAFLRAVLARPRVLLLDEPDAALDDVSANAVSALTVEFAAEGGAVVRVRHHGSDGVASRRLRLEGGLLHAEEDA